ncbi:hypothetical protein IQ238_26370 [Pleurocapsales cyanobacterium LEGE 06147]|nr:hypothetical protein [Pleurocapsales cyanobacterium LEGE 06147]
MTPEAIRIVAQLRREFYTLLAATIQVPVSISKDNPSTSCRSMASWIDDRKRLNYVLVYAYIAPDALVPKRPFILRVAVNKGAGLFVNNTKWRKDCRSLNQSWDFELTLLPEEILDFLPWVVSLIESQDNYSASFVETPPHPLNFQITHVKLLQDAWTQKAWQYHADSKLLCV